MRLPVQDGAGSPRRHVGDGEHSSHRSGGHSGAFANGTTSGGGAARSPTLQRRSGSTQPNGSIGSPGVQQPSRKRKRPASPSEEVQLSPPQL